MQDMKSLLQGIYQFMIDVKVPIFDNWFSLWTIFLFGLLGGLVVWFLVKFLK